MYEGFQEEEQKKITTEQIHFYIWNRLNRPIIRLINSSWANVLMRQRRWWSGATANVFYMYAQSKIYLFYIRPLNVYTQRTAACHKLYFISRNKTELLAWVGKGTNIIASHIFTVLKLTFSRLIFFVFLFVVALIPPFPFVHFIYQNVF